MSATIKRGVKFTLPAWKARRRGERTRYATVTRVVGGVAYYRFDAHGPSHARSKALLERHAEVESLDDVPQGPVSFYPDPIPAPPF